MFGLTTSETGWKFPKRQANSAKMLAKFVTNNHPKMIKCYENSYLAQYYINRAKLTNRHKMTKFFRNLHICSIQDIPICNFFLFPKRTNVSVDSREYNTILKLMETLVHRQIPISFLSLITENISSHSDRIIWLSHACIIQWILFPSESPHMIIILISTSIWQRLLLRDYYKRLGLGHEVLSPFSIVCHTDHH